MRGSRHISLLICVFALVLAGCGGGDGGTIPPGDADNLLNQLDAIQNDVANGDCETAQQHALEFQDGVNNLPNDVDSEVASELTKAAKNLDELASDPSECTESGATGITGAETTDTTDTETTEPETTVTETTTPEEETTTEETTDEEPTEPETQPPAGGGNQGNQGNQGAPPTPQEGGIPAPPSGGVEPGGEGK